MLTKASNDNTNMSLLNWMNCNAKDFNRSAKYLHNHSHLDLIVIIHLSAKDCHIQWWSSCKI